MILENIKAGCIGISDDGFPVSNSNLLFSAMELAKRLIELYPNSSEPYVILGDMQSQATEFEDAIESYNKATNIKIEI